ncbi:response regulator transcription factor [Clostridium sp. 'deep sea']|uniref:response regulator transcription factor n=1 Tax=Clostridium sp. 'deep sea' TaxID=2779445 RepID=UPI00189649A2|nr:response regulator transcription factor [Clostridium sp. 'deep sea']QOR35477.1 response regulator transcription factor [Clostridium sp. 'deep sea']
MSKILLIEDDIALVKNLSYHLEQSGYFVYKIDDFSNVENCLKQLDYNLAIIDLNLPYTDGFYLCKMIRQQSHVPIIILSARNKEMEQVLGIELGADDYITKPFSISILLAKIKSLLRRSNSYNTKVKNDYRVNGLGLDLNNFCISYLGKELELAKNELKLLKNFFENKNKVITREELLECLWDTDVFVDDNTLTVNVTRVKKKLKKLGLEDVIKTKWGVGYVFNTNAIPK